MMSLKELFTFRVLFALLSGRYLLLLAGWLVAPYIFPHTQPQTFYFLGNVTLGLIFVRVATLIHESGHIAIALLFGGTPRRLVLGKGHEVFRGDVKGVKLIIHESISAGGFVLTTWPNDEQQHKIVKVLFILGGVIANVAAAAIVFLLFGIGSLYAGWSLSAAFVFANLATLVNLFPFRSMAFNFPMESDGLQLFKLLFLKKRASRDPLLADRMMDGVDLFESKNYADALKLFESLFEKYPDDFFVAYNYSNALLKTGDIEKSFLVMKALENSDHSPEDKRWKPLVFNHLAWTLLLRGEIDEAFQYSSKAFAALPKVAAIQGTHGSILIEKGYIDAGLPLLHKHADIRYVNSNTLSSAIYLAKAYEAKCNETLSKKYMSFVERNLDKLERDEYMLWSRARSVSFVTIE